MIPFPSIDESRRLVLDVVCNEPTPCRELSSYDFPLSILRLFMERKRDRMEGMEVVMMTRYVSMNSQRSYVTVAVVGSLSEVARTRVCTVFIIAATIALDSA